MPMRIFNRRRFSGLIKASVALWVLGCGGGVPRPLIGSRPPPPVEAIVLAENDTADEKTSVAQRLLKHHNQRRAESELPPLSLASRLTDAARVHVEGMIELGKASHQGVDGSTPADRVRRQNYPYLNVGENVAAGQRTVEAVMTGWMNSPEHRENILGDFTEMGAARESDEEGRLYWCVVFATPLPQLDPKQAADDLKRLINERREDQSLSMLQGGPTLMSIARSHVRAMASAGSLKTRQADPIKAVRERNIPYRKVALAAFSGQPTPDAVLQAMTENRGHRNNLLGDFDRIGIGYATDQDGTPYWSVVFLRSPDR